MRMNGFVPFVMPNEPEPGLGDAAAIKDDFGHDPNPVAVLPPAMPGVETEAASAAVALITLVLAPYARFVPRSALAGILMVTAVGMIDWKALPFHMRATKFDAFIVLTTGIAAVGISVEFCIPDRRGCVVLASGSACRTHGAYGVRGSRHWRRPREAGGRGRE